MIEDLDTYWEKLLKDEKTLRKSNVSVAFDQPRHDWSNSRQGPTINVFLYDIHENNTLRQIEWRTDMASSTKQRAPVRLDLHYLITTWADVPEDEHIMLTDVLMALFRQPHLSQEFLPDSLKSDPPDPPVRIPLRVAEQDALRNVADLWGVLDNELRPAISCVITLTLNPYAAQPLTLVKRRKLQVGQADRFRPENALASTPAQGRPWAIGGTLRRYKEFRPEQVTLKLLELEMSVPVRPDGRFKISNLEDGKYTLEVTVDGSETQRRTITLPAPGNDDYDIVL